MPMPLREPPPRVPGSAGCRVARVSRAGDGVLAIGNSPLTLTVDLLRLPCTGKLVVGKLPTTAGEQPALPGIRRILGPRDELSR